MQDGLSQMKIGALECDSKGNIWIATRNGLNKFNGGNFKVYDTEDGLLHERIHDIAINSENKIISLTYKGLSIFDGSSFQNFERPFIYVMYNLYVDSNDIIWIQDLNQNEIYYFLDGEYVLFKHEQIDKSEKSSLFFNKINKQIYLGQSSGIYKVHLKDNLQLEKISEDPASNFIPGWLHSGEPLFAIKKSNDSAEGKMIMGDTTKSAYFLSLNDGNPKIELYTKEDLYLKYFSYFLLPSKKGGYNLTNEFSEVNDLVIDKQGQTWLGTEVGLIHIYSNEFEDVSPRRFPYVWSVIEDSQFNMWTASYGDGLYIGDKLNRFRKIDHQLNIENLFMAASEMDKNGVLYFGNVNALIKYEDDEFSFVSKKSTFSLKYDEGLDYLLAGVENGFFIIENSIIKDTVDHKDGLHECHYIQTIDIDKEGCYWVGSYTGLSKYDPRTKLVTNFSAKQPALIEKGIYSIYNDSKGNLWFGGEEGLLHYDRHKDSIISIESKLLNHIVKSIINLDDDNLLIGAKDGLYIFNTEEYFNTKTIDLKIINQTNGYTGIEPGFTGFYKDSEDNIWITSATNLVKFSPNEILEREQFLNTSINRINDERIHFEHFQDPYLIINSGDVKIDFEAVGTIRPSTLLYQYKLNEEEWSEWQIDDFVVLNNLNSGKYKFEVRSGPTDHQPIQSLTDHIYFQVEIPFYKAAWFPGVALIILLSILALAVYYYIRALLAANKFQKKNYEVNYLRSQLLLAELNPHFIFNVLASIQSKVFMGEKKEASNYIVKLASLMRNFLEASYRGNEALIDGHEHEILLSKEIELINSFILFEQEKSNNHFESKIYVHPDLQPDNTFIPPMLIQPFIENAIKHGLLPIKSKGQLSVEFLPEPNGLRCIISDNGAGIDKDKKSDYKTHHSLGSTIVKERIQTLNELGYQIKLHIDSKKMQGTQVTLIILEEQ